MGIGDELQAAGQVKRAQRADARRARILDVNGGQRWHPVWEHNPRIARLGEVGDFQDITNGPNARPYIAGKTPDKWEWKEYAGEPGEIYLAQSELDFARHFRPQIVIEPNIKQRASPNKQWGEQRWQNFVFIALKAGYQLAQFAPAGAKVLQGVQAIETPDFRQACAVLKNATAFVGPDGGLMHAAAAFGIPAVIIRGAFISQKCTGYPSQRNLFFGPGLGCGMRVPCNCCKAAMAKITADMVLNELTLALEQK